jgi:ADP-ribosylglycohydrolase
MVLFFAIGAKRRAYKQLGLPKKQLHVFVCQYIKGDTEMYNTCLELAVKGFILGDAAGVPYENKKRGTFNCNEFRNSRWNDSHFILPLGTWSDDTSLMLCVLEALNHEKIEKRWVRNSAKFMLFGFYTNHFFKVPYDVGNTCRKGILYSLIGKTNPKASQISSNGNGGIMRMLPLAFVKINTTEDLLQLISVFNSNSHGHRISNMGCLIYISILRKLIQGNIDIPTLLQEINDELKEYETVEYETILSGKILNLSADSIKSTGYVVDTLEAAIWALANSKNYEETVFNAINLGGDTDTISAIAGSMAALKYKDFNKKWWSKIKRRKFVDGLIIESKINI